MCFDVGLCVSHNALKPVTGIKSVKVIIFESYLIGVRVHSYWI